MKNKEISELIAKSRAYNSSSFLLRIGQNNENTLKNIAFLAPKKIFKTAVLRNKARRRLKNAFIKVIQDQKNLKNIDFQDKIKAKNLIFSLKKDVFDIDFTQLYREVYQNLLKIL